MRVNLTNTLGILNAEGERVYVGPGEAEVPDAYVEALGLKPVESPEPQEPTNTLPADLPGRKVLIASNILSLEAAVALEKDGLVKLDGIGDKTSQEILDYKAS